MDPNINPETGETMSSGSSPRFSLWSAFLVFSAITLGAAVQVKNAAAEITSAERYAVACAIVTFVLTLIVVAAHFFAVAAAIFVQTKVEGVCIIVLVALWCTIVAIGTDAGRSLGDEGSDAVQNANLYYFSWAGFVTSVLLLVSFLRAAFGLDMVGEMQNRGKRLQWWAALLAAGIVIVGASSRVHSRDCQADSDGGFSDSYCRKTKFGISVGSLTVAFTILVIATKIFKYSETSGPTPFMVEIGSSILLTILNAFGVAYITSADAPGSEIGNLYYFSWASFLVSAMLVAECYSDYVNPGGDDNKNQENGHNGTHAESNGNGGADIEVETFDDAI